MALQRSATSVRMLKTSAFAWAFISFRLRGEDVLLEAKVILVIAHHVIVISDSSQMRIDVFGLN